MEICLSDEEDYEVAGFAATPQCTPSPEGEEFFDASEHADSDEEAGVDEFAAIAHA